MARVDIQNLLLRSKSVGGSSCRFNSYSRHQPIQGKAVKAAKHDLFAKEKKMKRVFVSAVIVVVALLLTWKWSLCLDDLTSPKDKGRSDIYTKTFRYAQRTVYQNIKACGCDMIMVEGSETWSDGEDTLLYTAVYEISGGIGPQKPRRVRLEVKYFKSAKSFASTYIDVANPPKIRLDITGVKN